jgi:hypothetical protein
MELRGWKRRDWNPVLTAGSWAERMQLSVPLRGSSGQALLAQALILATQEAEIRRIMVQSQPRQTVHETLS